MLSKECGADHHDLVMLNYYESILLINKKNRHECVFVVKNVVELKKTWVEGHETQIYRHSKEMMQISEELTRKQILP